jgi:hypothetical protein
MPQFDIYLRNPIQWGIRQVWAPSAEEALEEARRLIEDEPRGFEMFYDGEFCDYVTEIRICEPGDVETHAMWRSADHGLRLFARDLLNAADNVVNRWSGGNLAEAVRQLAAVIGKTREPGD